MFQEKEYKMKRRDNGHVPTGGEETATTAFDEMNT